MTLNRPYLTAWTGLAAVAAAAWVAFPRMPMAPHASDFLAAFAMWTVMMAAMMAPSVAPAAGLYGSLVGERSGARAAGARTPCFAAGYLAAWTLFSALAAAAQGLLLEGRLISPMLASASRPFTAAVLLAAAAWQLTPAKRACMVKCRSPLGLFLSEWRDGAVGGFLMGAKLGGYCVACCWALMAIMFVVGAMSLGWMAALAALVLAEKLAPERWRLEYFIAAVLASWGTAILVVS